MSLFTNPSYIENRYPAPQVSTSSLTHGLQSHLFPLIAKMKLLSLYRNSFLLLIFVMSSPHPGAMPSRPQRIGVFKRNWASDIADDAKRFWDDLKRVVPWASGTAFNKMLPDELKDIPLPERIQAAFGLDEQRTSGLPLRVFNFP